MTLRSRAVTLTLSLVVALAGCTVPVEEPAPASRPVPRPAAPPAPSEPVPGGVPATPEPAPGPAAPAPIPPPPPPPSSGATASLLQQGRQQAAAGNYAVATSTLERALRINPRDSDLWVELGRVKLKQGDFAQAESMGRRGLAVAGTDPARRARCEELIAAARRGR